MKTFIKEVIKWNEWTTKKKKKEKEKKKKTE